MSLDTALAGLTVEIGFGVNAAGGDFFNLDDSTRGVLDNTTYRLAPETVYIDVAASVASIKTDRGRARETDEYKVGTASVVLNDTDRRFDPAYGYSPYVGQITPMRRLRVKWNDVWVFPGWVDDWAIRYEPADSLSRVTAECVDAFGILANQELSEIAPGFSGDKAGTRINRALNRAEINFPPSRSVDTGESTLGATTFGGNALSYVQACSKAEAGYLFVAADGTLTFRSRTGPLNDLTDVVFSDDRDAGIPYMNITQRSSTDLLYTRVTGTSETTSNEVESTSESAKAEYFTRTLNLGTLFTIDDAETQNIVDYYLERFSAPELRFEIATINVAALSDDQIADILALELSDVVTVERLPLQNSASWPVVDGGYRLPDSALVTLDSGGYKEA